MGPSIIQIQKNLRQALIMPSPYSINLVNPTNQNQFLKYF